MTLPTYVGAGALSSQTSANNTPQTPAATAVDDILICFVETNTNAITLVTANGFVALTGSPWGNSTSTNGTWLSVYWKRATAAGAQNGPTVSHANHTIGQIL